MLFLKHIITCSLRKMCNVKCSVKDSIRKEKSLQARVERKILHKRNRASCLVSCQASVTVEASLVFPIFLCAFVCFISLAQMVLIETEMHHAVSQTAKIYAKQQSISFVSGMLEEGSKKRENDKGKGKVEGIFYSVYDGGSLCENMVEGGRRGIKLSSSISSGQEVCLKAEYTLKISVPFFSAVRFYRKTIVKRRMFSGYVKHSGENDAAEGNQIVYVAENGIVYHKNPQCSHIYLRISGSMGIQGILHSSKYGACEKCIHKGTVPTVLFITKYGDCYHSTLACSGLKRTVKTVRMKDVNGLRPCSRCSSKS